MTSKKRKALAAANYDLFEPVLQTVPGELPTIEELYERFRRYNVRYFHGELPTPKIRYSKRLLAAGLYIRDRGEIVISEKYHTIFPEDINDTLKHEMIHLVHFNHDANFRREAARIGASQRAKSHPNLRLPPRFIYHCPVCKIEYPRRKRLRMASCGKCSPSGFAAKYKLVLKTSLAPSR
jgi:predicted SprT family Zn-dependent metalloprotease